MREELIVLAAVLLIIGLFDWALLAVSDRFEKRAKEQNDISEKGEKK